MIVASVNWTTVLVALITAIPAIIAATVAVGNRRSLRTPSGDSIGHVVERTHDLAAISTLAVSGVTATDPLRAAARRLNASGDAPIKVNGSTLPEASKQGEHPHGGGHKATS